MEALALMRQQVTLELEARAAAEAVAPEIQTLAVTEQVVLAVLVATAILL
jgi:hypothetical protein